MTLLWIQTLVSLIGLVVSAGTCFDAWWKFRTLRHLGLNGPREALTLGTLLSEVGRVYLHVCLVAIAGLFWLRPVPMAWTVGTLILFSMSVSLMLVSLNSWMMNRKVLQALAMQQPETRG